MYLYDRFLIRIKVNYYRIYNKYISKFVKRSFDLFNSIKRYAFFYKVN